MIYNVLDTNDYASEVYADTRNLFAYIDSFVESLGFDEFEIDESKLLSVVQVMRGKFPYAQGHQNANPFKKVAYFVVNFIAERPLLSSFPDYYVVKDTQINTIKNHQNAVLAYFIAIDSLENAKIHRTNGEDVEIILNNRIKVSKHSFVDIIESISDATPLTHFKTLTVLFEQLAYRSNPHASYPLEI